LSAAGGSVARLAPDASARASAVTAERLTFDDGVHAAPRRVDAMACLQRVAMDLRGDELRSVKTGAMVAPAHARVARREHAMT